MNILRQSRDITLPTGIADAFVSSAKQLAPAGLSLPDLRNVTNDADWLRSHMAHRLELWVQTVEPVRVHWVSFDGLYKRLDSEYRERLLQWRWPDIDGLRKGEAASPRPEPKRWLGMNEAWDKRAQQQDIGEHYHQALTLCLLEQAAGAAYYLTCPAKRMAAGLPSIGWSLASVLAYSVQLGDSFEASERWIDECNRIQQLSDENWTSR
jgi:hypothetical protein